MMSFLAGLLFNHITLALVVIAGVVLAIAALSGRLIMNKYVLSALLVALIGWGLYGYGYTAGKAAQAEKTAAIKAEYDGFVEQTKTIGEAAKKAATEQTARDKAAKTKADNENTRSIDKLRADVKRLRNARASSNFVPAAPANSIRPELACFSRPDIESAIRTFDSEISGLIEQGDEATVNLDTAKQWAGDQAALK